MSDGSVKNAQITRMRITTEAVCSATAQIGGYLRAKAGQRKVTERNLISGSVWRRIG